MKLQTTDEYLQENPDCILVYNQMKDDGLTAVIHSNSIIETGILRLDWSGRSKTIFAGPNVQWSRKQVIEWQDWQICKPYEAISPAEKGWELQLHKLPDNCTAFRFGKYIDAKPMTRADLYPTYRESRFLLWKFFVDEHGLTLLDSQLDDIISAVEEYSKATYQNPNQ